MPARLAFYAMDKALKAKLEQLELGFWEATRDGDYYRKNMAGDGLAVFADMFLTKDQAIASTSGDQVAAWSDVSINDVRAFELGDGAAGLVYRGQAKRDGTPYSANVTSVYVRRDGDWQMILHQQSANSANEGP